MNPVPHAPRGDRKHSPELPAAQDAYRCSRKYRSVAHNSVFRTVSVCCSRHARSFSRRSLRWLERIAMASSAARFSAPAFPTAPVCASRNAARHLNDRQQRVHSLQRSTFNRDSKHRQNGLSGHHPRKMRSPSRPGNDHFQPALFRRRSVFRQQPRSAMRRHNFRFVRNTEAFEQFARMAHGVPIGLAPHHHADQRFPFQPCASAVRGPCRRNFSS